MKVLVLSAPGFHLGYIGCYGNEWIATPTLDRLAAEGIVFDQHIADHPDALGGRRALQSASYSMPWPEWRKGPIEHQAHRRLLADLRENGVHTVLIASKSAGSATGMKAEWGQVEEPSGDSAEAASLEQSLDRTLDVLDEIAADQWLAVVELDALLPPWHMPDEFREAYCEDESDDEMEQEPTVDLEATDSLEAKEPTLSEVQREFAGAVTYFDAVLERFLGDLQERAWAKDVLLVVTSDRGQTISEERQGSASQTRLHEELIHIPLILRFADSQAAGRRISALTQSVDLVPTLFELFGLPVPQGHGQSLVPLIRGTAAQVRDYAVAGIGTEERLESTLRSLEWSFLLPLQQHSTGTKLDPELYVKPDDRWEVNNVWQHHVELTERLEKTLDAFLAATQHPGPFVAPRIPDEEETGEHSPRTR